MLDDVCLLSTSTISSWHVEKEEEQGWWRDDSANDRNDGTNRGLRSIWVNWQPMCVQSGALGLKDGTDCSWAKTITTLYQFDSKGLCGMSFMGTLACFVMTFEKFTFSVVCGERHRVVMLLQIHKLRPLVPGKFLFNWLLANFILPAVQ